MARALSLYPVLLLCVLLASGCTSDEAHHASSPVTASGGERAAPAPTPDRADDAQRVVLVLGNSLAAGYGLNETQAFPALIQKKIDSLGWDFRVVNAGVSGETSAGGLARIDWLLEQRVDVLLLELGANDGLRGIPPQVMKQNLEGIILRTRQRYPDARVVIAGMQMPPNLGRDFSERYRQVFPDLARKHDAALIPFLLDRVGGVPSMNLSDGIHPTAEGQRLIAETVWTTLKPVLESLQERAA
jgi:acyl-CoA thioesterase I